MSPSGSKEKLLASAQKFMRKGQFRKAIQEYEKVLKEDPSDVRSRLNLANLYYRQKDVDNAVATFLEVAKIYEDGGFALKAIAVYKQVLKIVPGRPDLFLSLARNYQQHGLLNEAAAQYREALKLLGQAGDTLGKLSIIRQILDLDPDNVVDRLRLAESYSAHGQIFDAVREFRKVAQLLEKLGYVEDYQRIAERLLYHEPGDAQTAKRLAASYVAADQPQRALPKLKTAFRASPRDLEVLGTLADAFSQLGQTHKAVTVLKEMARLYDQSGLDRERDECYREILVLNPDDPVAKEQVARFAQDDAGRTIEFDQLAEGEEGLVLPPPPRRRLTTPRSEPAPAAPPPEPAAEPSWEIDDDVSFEAPAEAPAVEIAAAGVESEPEPEAVIEDLIRDALGPEPSPLPAPQVERSRTQAERDLEELFASALGEDAATPAPVSLAEFAAEGLGEFEFELEEGFDDELGFGRDEEEVEVTLADESFIPEDVLKEVQGGFDLVVPPRREDPAKTGAPETFRPGEELLAEELAELDFYLQNRLRDEARLLLSELEDRYPGHPYVARRRERIGALG